jgi:tryptophan synthase beta subunit
LQEVLSYLSEQFYKFSEDPDFKEELRYYLREYVGRENPLTYAERLSKESKRQMMEKEGRLPDGVMACAGGGSNAIGAFAHYIDEPTAFLNSRCPEHHSRLQVCSAKCGFISKNLPLQPAR